MFRKNKRFMDSATIISQKKLGFCFIDLSKKRGEIL